MQLVILLIIVGFSLVSWIFRKVQEEAERRRVRDQMAARELERLRTGREPDADGETTAQQQRAQELAARRQAQLQELRRRQEERARQQQQAQQQRPRVGTTTPTANGPSTGRQPPPVWVPGQPTQQRPAGRAHRTPEPIIQRQQTRQAPAPARAQQPAPRVQTPTRRVLQPKTPRKALFPDAPPPPPRPKQVKPAAEVYAKRGTGPAILQDIRPRSREEWRRAMVLHEVLSPPVGERQSREF